MKRSPEPITSERELYERALKLLSQKSRSRWELGRLLKKRCPDDRPVRAVLDKCIARGYLDDVQYAIHLARHHAERKRQGRRRVAQELRARGLSADHVQRALEEVFLHIDESQLLRRTLEARLKDKRGKLDTKKKKKLYDQLVRAGFNTDLILRELRRHQIALPRDPGETAAEDADLPAYPMEEETD